MDIDFILPDPADPKIFHFKDDVRASLIKIFIGNQEIDNKRDDTLVLFKGNAAIRLNNRSFLAYV